jgi:hypothetical protein
MRLSPPIPYTVRISYSGGQKHLPGGGHGPAVSGLLLASWVPCAGSIVMTNAVNVTESATMNAKEVLPKAFMRGSNTKIKT